MPKNGEGAGQSLGNAGALFRFRGRASPGGFARNAVPVDHTGLRIFGMAADLLIAIGIVAEIAGRNRVRRGIVDPEVLTAYEL